METYKIISEKVLKDLLLNDEILRRLEAGGVDNWTWYSESLNEYGCISEYEDNELPEILARFPDYNVTELDNFNYD